MGQISVCPGETFPAKCSLGVFVNMASELVQTKVHKNDFFISFRKLVFTKYS
jgi:hypothetical protein